MACLLPPIYVVGTTHTSSNGISEVGDSQPQNTASLPVVVELVYMHSSVV